MAKKEKKLNVKDSCEARIELFLQLASQPHSKNSVYSCLKNRLLSRRNWGEKKEANKIIRCSLRYVGSRRWVYLVCFFITGRLCVAFGHSKRRGGTATLGLGLGAGQVDGAEALLCSKPLREKSSVRS